MTDETHTGGEFLETVEEMRRRFDETFSRAVEPEQTDPEQVVLIEVGTEHLAVRVAELTGLRKRPSLTRLPASAPGVVGLAGIRGKPVPVFALSKLLGIDAVGPESERSEALQTGSDWLLITGEEEVMGFSFDALRGYAHLDPEALSKASASAGAYRTALARVDEKPYSLLSIEMLRTEILGRRRGQTP